MKSRRITHQSKRLEEWSLESNTMPKTHSISSMVVEVGKAAFDDVLDYQEIDETDGFHPGKQRMSLIVSKDSARLVQSETMKFILLLE
jgi:hypothetical protein